MRSILVLLFVLFFGVLAQAQNTPVKKVEVVEKAKVDLTLSHGPAVEVIEPNEELSLVYKRRRSAVKKHLFFTFRKNWVKIA